MNTVDNGKSLLFSLLDSIKMFAQSSNEVKPAPIQNKTKSEQDDEVIIGNDKVDY